MRKIILVFFLCAGFNLFCNGQSTELKNIKTSLPLITDSLKYADALNRLGMLMYEKNVDSSFHYTKLARELSGRLHYAKGKADALNNLGVFFDIKGNLQLAMRYYNEAHVAYTDLKDAPNQVQTTMNIAMVYKEMGKDDRALQWFNAALQAGNSLKQDSIQSLVIFNYLLLYPHKFDKTTKLSLIEKAKLIGRKYNDQRVLLAINQLIADDLIAEGKTVQGITMLDETIKDGLNKKLYYFLMDLLLDIGDKLLITNEKSAVAYYKQGLDIAESNSYLLYNEIFAKRLFDFYKQKGDTEPAALYSGKLVSLYEQKEAVNAASGIDYLDYVFKQQELNVLQQRSNYQTLLLILIIIICVSVIIFLVIIRKNLGRTKALNKLVLSQNSQMKQAIKALEESQTENTKMLKVIAHDLRNPIAAVWSMIMLLLKDADRTPRDIKAFGLMSKASTDALDLVSGLLNQNTRPSELKKESIDLVELIEYCLSMVRDKADSKAQQIHLEVVPATILAAREKLWRVISNLISNAIKFSKKGATIVVKMEFVNQNVRVMIQDHGIGIPQALQPNIFNAFTESRRPGTEGEEPFGLGLFISKQIIEAHGGRIYFESEEGKGTRFFIELPA